MNAFINTQRQAAGTSAFVPNQRLVFANACRLWLRVTTLSEIIEDNGKHISLWAMYGESQNTVDGRFPYQPKPPPQAWKAWRMALRQSVLGQTKADTHKLELLAPLQTAIPLQEPFTWAPKAHLRGAPLQYIFSTLPSHWQRLLTPHSWPSDDGDSIVNSLRASVPINGYIDGSVAKGSSAHAYTIRPECNNSDYAIVGTAMSPGEAQ